ncbi:MAG: type 4a pilus biogenesis protein PilO [Phycisphaerales bacterium]|nr:type 4a pilus biogenesis protein PilO [Phycisphaerales bacterium]
MAGFGLRAAIVSLVVVGLPVSSYFLVFRPTNVKLKRDVAECEQKEKYLAKLDELASRDTDLAKANEEIARSIKTIEARLPSGKDMDALVRQVSDLAVASGLKSPAIKSGKPLPAAMYMEQPLEMEVSGGFMGFWAFIAQVEKLPRITRVHDLKITAVGREDVEMRAEFTLSIYFQDDRMAVADTPKVDGGRQ